MAIDYEHKTCHHSNTEEVPRYDFKVEAVKWFHGQGRNYTGGAGGAAPPLAKSQSANQVQVTLSRQMEKNPEIGTIVQQKPVGK